MKVKRFMLVCLVVAMLVSALTVPASAANTQDTYYLYQWEGSKQVDFTPGRVKQDSSPTYIKASYETLPIGGFWAGTYYGSSEDTATSNQASASDYLIDDYLAYTIRANAARESVVNKYVAIRGRYSAYSWGNCTVAWSPDTANPSAYPSLN